MIPLLVMFAILTEVSGEVGIIFFVVAAGTCTVHDVAPGSDPTTSTAPKKLAVASLLTLRLPLRSRTPECPSMIICIYSCKLGGSSTNIVKLVCESRSPICRRRTKFYVATMDFNVTPRSPGKQFIVLPVIIGSAP